MKKLLLLVGLMIFSIFSFAQVTNLPLSPTDSEEITITFDATGTNLEDYTGEVYAWTGVTVNGLKWQNIIGGWNDNVNNPQLTRDAVNLNLYTLIITTSIFDYYGVAPLDNITELGFVFRSADGAITTTQNGGNDIFIPIIATNPPPVILDNWGVVGDATPNGWGGPDFPLSYNETTNNWSAVVPLTDGAIKFRKDNNWSVNYGDNGFDGSLESGGANISVSAGNYLITANFGTLEYSIESVIFIPDANFEQALINNGIDSDGVVNTFILREDAEAITILSVGGNEISSLIGIEAFINITELFAGNNELTEIDLSQNTELLKIWVHLNQLASIDLSNNTKMQRVSVGGNQLTELDVSMLPDVHTILAWQNKLTSFDVSNKPLLTSMNIQDNLLTSINLANTPILDNFNVTNNLLTNIDLSQNPDLTRIDIVNNQLSQLDISSNQKLNWLNAQYNLGLKLITVPITGSPSLTALDLSGTGLSNFNPTLYPNLEILWLNENSISRFNTNNILNLKALVMNDNELTTLDLSTNTLLLEVQLKNNLLTELDMRNDNNDAIGRFWLNNNPLTCISVDDPDDITIPYETWEMDAGVVLSLDCSAEPEVILIPGENFEQSLIDLGIDGNIGDLRNGSILVTDAEVVTNLIVNGNDISDLTGIEGFINLTDLNVSGNLLEEQLDLTENINIVNLDVSDNFLNNLVITSGRELQTLDISSNEFVTIDISSFSNLTVFDATDNPNLLCIGVSDPNNIPAGWSKDVTASYSNNPDCVPPTIISKDVTIYLDNKGNATVSGKQFDNGSSDNVSANADLIFSLDITDFDCFDLGNPNIELTVTDEAGNSAFQNVNLYVEDNLDPKVTTINDFTYDLNGMSAYTITAQDVVKSSSDNCEVIDFSIDQSIFTSPGVYTVTLTATDSSGNTAEDTIDITIVDSASSAELKFKQNQTLTIYPVPFSTELNILFSKAINLNNVQVILFTSSGGNTGITFNEVNGALVGNGSGLPAGIYVLQITISGQTKSVNIVRE